MVSVLKKSNVKIKVLSTTLVGGASVIGKSAERQSIGEKNVLAAKKMLHYYGIKINRELI
jgi:chemotaxis receptor (MCP) glutamine deamidase CheD